MPKDQHHSRHRAFEQIVRNFPRNPGEEEYIRHSLPRAWQTLSVLPHSSSSGLLVDVGSMRGIFAPACSITGNSGYFDFL